MTKSQVYRAYDNLVTCNAQIFRHSDTELDECLVNHGIAVGLTPATTREEKLHAMVNKMLRDNLQEFWKA